MKYSVIKKFSGRNLLRIFEKIKEDTKGNAVLLGYEEKLVGGEKFYEIVVGIPDTSQEATKSINEIREILEKIEDLRRDFFYVKENIDFISKRAMSPAELKLPPEALYFFKKLVSRGVERSIALSITEDILESRMPFDSKSLSFIISKYMTFKNPLREKGKRFLALVGPTGVGKTTTAAKIAALYIFNYRSKNIALLETDRYRIASVDQIKKYAEIMGIPLFVAVDPKEFRQIIPNIMRFDFVVVDTMGKSQYDINNIKKIASIIREIGSHFVVEIALLISTSQKDEEIVQVIRGFSEVGIDYFIFTKVDETSYPGTILNVGCTAETPVAFITTGQSVPDDIKIASPDVISDIILGPPPITRYILRES